jgi:hypothetical protein
VSWRRHGRVSATVSTTPLLWRNGRRRAAFLTLPGSRARAVCHRCSADGCATGRDLAEARCNRTRVPSLRLDDPDCLRDAAAALGQAGEVAPRLLGRGLSRTHDALEECERARPRDGRVADDHAGRDNGGGLVGQAAPAGDALLDRNLRGDHDGRRRSSRAPDVADPRSEADGVAGHRLGRRWGIPAFSPITARRRCSPARRAPRQRCARAGRRRPPCPSASRQGVRPSRLHGLPQAPLPRVA